ncbi:hypothetical protein IZ6_24650 [Terrihabitans soli]|uniref:MtN3 and saliva related transmembrane protein n=1 Tax=Terrihabitans soli TaxID=708113 RepID=A0A6S6QXH3_9HYPH|nr:hypothetical protein [Terrihabitans soli]BCJ91730.1 hypothetical protein IZ6_24650 [Terrihabitans soli]
MNPDLLNAAFEAAAALFILNHCRVLYRDKSVRGVSITSTVFFTGWGFWNLIYYPSLGQSWSFYAGMAVVAANALWLGLMLFYLSKERKAAASFEKLQRFLENPPPPSPAFVELMKHKPNWVKN